MAAYNQYDPRLESLVVETRTLWDKDVQGLSAEDKTLVAQSLHRAAKLVGKINYERTHTGFTREITVSAADIERLYHDRVAS